MKSWPLQFLDQKATQFWALISKPWIALLVFAVLFLIHSWNAIIHALDVPYWDEWEFFTSAALKDLNLDWVLRFHNEHRIVPTKLVVWVQHNFLGGVNFATLQVFNVVLVLVLIFCLVQFWRSTQSDQNKNAFLPFLVFFASIFYSENIHWGFQSQFHFFLIFSLIGFQLLTVPSNTRIVLASLFFTLSFFSFSAGVIIGTVGYLTALFLLTLSRDRTKLSRIATTLGICFLFAGSVWIWKLGYPKLDGHPDYVFPTNIKFWSHFLALLSGAFGNSKVNDLIFFLTLVAFLWLAYRAIFWLKLNFKKLSTDRTQKELVFLAWSVSIILILASISIGRAGFGTAQGLSGRYMQISMLLLPVLVWSLQNSLSKSLVYRHAPLILWIACGIGFSNDFDYTSRYLGVKNLRLRGLECLKTSTEKNCPDLYPHPLSERLQIARDVGATFTQKLDK